MPITELYLPQKGLQGERIPSHILWHIQSVVKIQIIVPSFFEPEAVYNTDAWEFKDDILSIKDIKWEGYLGLVFKTRKVEDVEINCKLEYMVEFDDGSIDNVIRVINMFRPQLEINVKNYEVIVDPIIKSVRNKLILNNIGKGCLILSINSIEDSELNLLVKDDYKIFYRNFKNDLIEELQKLCKEYPRYEEYLLEYLEWIELDFFILDQDTRNQFIDFLNRFNRVVSNEKEFSSAFIDAFLKSFVKNVEILKQLEHFIRNFESLITNNIVIVNPFDEIEIKKGKNILNISIIPTDKIFNAYTAIDVRDIIINGNHEGTIPIYQLFEKVIKRE